MNVFSLSWAAAGLALLGLSLFPAGSLALGGAPAHQGAELPERGEGEAIDTSIPASGPCCWTTSPPITRCSSPNGPRPSGMGAASRP